MDRRKTALPLEKSILLCCQYTQSIVIQKFWSTLARMCLFLRYLCIEPMAFIISTKFTFSHCPMITNMIVEIHSKNSINAPAFFIFRKGNQIQPFKIKSLINNYNTYRGFIISIYTLLNKDSHNKTIYSYPRKIYFPQSILLQNQLDEDIGKL